MKTRAECLEEYGSDYFVEKKIEKGELFKVGKGIYSEKKYVPDIAMFVYKYPYVVVTMRSAFYFFAELFLNYTTVRKKSIITSI